MMDGPSFCQENRNFFIHRPLRLKRGNGAGDGSRTRDLQLGKLPLYQLSYTRTAKG